MSLSISLQSLLHQLWDIVEKIGVNDGNESAITWLKKIITSAINVKESDEISIFTLERIKRELENWRADHIEDVEEWQDYLVELSNWYTQTFDDTTVSYIKESGIKGAGYGLYARVDIPDEDAITVYGGFHFDSMDDLLYLYPEANGDVNKINSAYLIQPDKERGAMIDGKRWFTLDEQGRWANTQVEKKRCNAEFRFDDEGNVWVVATANIAKDTEIFVWYSDEYAAFLGGKCIECHVNAAAWEYIGRPTKIFCGTACAQSHWNKL